MDEMENAGPQVSEFKGKPILTLNPGDRFPFSFGVAKAKMIMQNLEAIKKFIEQYSEKAGSAQES